MGVKYNPKRDRHIDAAKAAAIKLGVDGLAPEILFGGASNDDLDLYSADMLALIAAHAHRELTRWDGGKPQVSVESVEGVAPGGTEVSIIAITEHNMPFLYDSIMGRSPARTATFTSRSTPFWSRNRANRQNSSIRKRKAIPRTASATSRST